ncbi:MmcQ/YjbR family DNA-binding protein [Gangjinia marincola]|uniref:MmcQ/YjbR family DNA-binding protein n=1 Tax=Gangjinia marincola TaxID=578463 RepID=A0ABN1MGZ0_9FLAO
MHIEELREYCLAKKGVTESFPFDNDTLVFKVMDKMFALFSLERIPLSVNLKCDPDYAIELREKHDGLINPGYHMSKKHWNTVIVDGQLSEKLVRHLINHSYDLVVSKLPKKVKDQFNSL